METIQLRKDPFNIIITGVGGQGNVLASRILSTMLVRKGYHATIGETFGASQRGGSVMSHIRTSAKSAWSPLIPKGRADLVIGLEPVEALRVLTSYGNQGITVLTNMRPIYPVEVIAGEIEYPSLEEIRLSITQLSSKAWFLNATEEAIGLGDPILGNIIMLGAASDLGQLPLDKDGFREVIKKNLPEEKLDANLKAFDLGIRILRTQRAQG